jgi:hypothetical protein
MNVATLLPALTSMLALIFSVALLDQWRERRHGFQLIWAIGMLFYGVASGAEAIAAASGWNEALYRTWYLTGAVWTAGWLGLGTAFLLGRTRFGYTYAFLLLFSGVIALMLRNNPTYDGAGPLPLLYLIVAAVVALAIGVETYFQNPNWPRLAAAALIVTTVLSVVLMAATTLPPPGYAVDTATGQPTAAIIPGYLRLMTPLTNFTGGLALVLGAVFSAYVFMPKRRVLAYSLDPNQPGDHFLFNLIIAVVAIPVNLVASLPGAFRALVSGRIHSRVPATILIAIGAFIPTVTDSMARLGNTDWFYAGKFLGVVFLFAGFLVSIEVFRQIRIPFTDVRLTRVRHESPEAARIAAEAAGPSDAAGSSSASSTGAASGPTDLPTGGAEIH